jgi:hypothetical protein
VSRKRLVEILSFEKEFQYRLLKASIATASACGVFR